MTIEQRCPQGGGAPCVWDGVPIQHCKVCGRFKPVEPRTSNPPVKRWNAGYVTPYSDFSSQPSYVAWEDHARFIAGQSKEIERLAAKHAEYYQQAEKLRDKLEDQIERLRATLEWYAKADYDQRICSDGDGHVDVWGGEEILEDKGRRAREALGWKP